MKQYGSPLYLFDEEGFVKNYQSLIETFRHIYPQYQIAYSFKTNYTPYIVETVKRLGGYAEVVSEMEYEIARNIGYEKDHIIFNGSNKGKGGVDAFLHGSIINVDSLDELDRYCDVAQNHPDIKFNIGIRVNLDIGQNFMSRFGIDELEPPETIKRVAPINNLSVNGLHCHISRCRSLDAWKKRTLLMLRLADRFFETAPMYIDLGSGMYANMEEFMKDQFVNVPTYQEYAGQ